jgi:hypothetical protein
MSDGLVLLVCFVAGLGIGASGALLWTSILLSRVHDLGRFAPFEATVVGPPPDTEERILQSAETTPEISDGMIERGAEDLLALAQRAGVPLAPDEARRHAEMMLHGLAPE